MAIPWLVALKVIPWGDVIEHAPKVLNAARKLLDRQRAPAPEAPKEVIDPPGAAQTSLAALNARLVSAQQEITQLAQTQAQLTQTLTELAEQNARLVGAVEVLRVRTRLLLWGMALLLLGVVWLAWR
ncbi:MAG: hypothetical protein IH617_01930 [Hydrogenophaga sp.]|nr:hypothetical protein [Hydrogenophaga sp.]